MRCSTKDCDGSVYHGVCSKCNQFCGCSFNPTSLNDYCGYHRPKFKRGYQVYSQADIDDAKDIIAAGEHENV